ncbi:MAG: NAD(P)-dependent alcohol dehydrogenase [Rhodospirillaceae bacterium]|nr:NAD(P)-dependent alcohol dehydrogenase [Rhodospirillaceae bacterium]
MRVMQIEGDWGLDNIRLAERPDPAPEPGQVVVKMKAASINFRDTVMVNRGYGRRSGELPLVPLSDGAGMVEAVGDGVSRVAVGDLVCPVFGQNWLHGTFREEYWSGTLGGPNDGTLQEKMLMPESGLVKAPAHLSAVEAAALPCAAVTAWNALVEQGQIKAGDSVLVQGTGGVSLFALQFAKMHGAEVVATSSSDNKLAKAREMGADHLINYKGTPDWARTARAVLGRAVDHIVEVGGAGTLEQSLRAVRPGGIISLIGVLSGGDGNLNLGPVVTQNIRLQGVTVGSRTMFENMNRAISMYGMKPMVDEAHQFTFEDVAEALRAFPQGRHFGKVCGLAWDA